MTQACLRLGQWAHSHARAHPFRAAGLTALVGGLVVGIAMALVTQNLGPGLVGGAAIATGAGVGVLLAIKIEESFLEATPDPTEEPR